MRLTLLILTSFSLVLGTAVPLPAEKTRVGVLYRDTLTGRRHMQGSEEAFKNWRGKNGRVAKEFAVLRGIPYQSEDDGVEELVRLRRERKFDVILGPTESGVFARALRRSVRPEQHPVPVISSLVTTQIEQDHESWFFRTNLDVSQRAHAVHDVMRKRWINSTAILYADTAFGRNAEMAYRREFDKNRSAANYLSLPFINSDELRAAVWEVLQKRPEAVGIFAERRYILEAHESLLSQNAEGVAYEPLLFSVLDVRLIASRLKEFFFVSVTRPNGAEAASNPTNGSFVDDIKGLSYDTTVFVLRIVEDLSTRPWDPEAFRKRFAALLEGGVKIWGEKTDMHFAAFKNETRPEVFYLNEGKIEPLPHTQALNLWQQFLFKGELVVRRFGYWPLIITGILFLTSWLMTFADVHRWYGGRVRAMIFNLYFLAFATLQGLFVVLLYLFLAETGRIAYDSLLAALLIAMAPAAVLKSTWFETPAGRAIGLKRIYNAILLWFNDKMMAELYRNRARYENVLVYFNSLPFLKARLTELYRSARTQERREALEEDFKQALEAAATQEDKLRVCAKRLLRQWRWKDLVEFGCVPQGYEDAHQVQDPVLFIKRCAEECLQRRIGSQDLERVIRDRLKSSAGEATAHYERKMEEVSSERGKIFVQIRFLVLRLGFTESGLKELLDQLTEERERVAQAAAGQGSV